MYNKTLTIRVTCYMNTDEQKICTSEREIFEKIVCVAGTR